MKEELIREVLDIYEILIESGITFYYGSESISTGEVTSFNILNEEIIELELDEFETYDISIDDFIEYHSKEGANYHTWHDIRRFDKKLSLINK